MIRIVIDKNLYISALINNNSLARLNYVLENPIVDVLLDDTLLTELHEVINRPKFKRYINPTQIQAFLQLLVERSSFIKTTSVVHFSPDPKDDFLLALCKDGQAHYLLTGNKIDLLDLKQFEQTAILTLSDFLTLAL